VTASTNFGPTQSGLDMTSDEHEVTHSVYLIVLSKDVASPLTAEDDEEKAAEPRAAPEPGSAEGGGRGGRGGTPAAPQYVIVSANAPVKPGEGGLRLSETDRRIGILIFTTNARESMTKVTAIQKGIRHTARQCPWLWAKRSSLISAKRSK
jgi:hypothetical protein